MLHVGKQDFPEPDEILLTFDSVKIWTISSTFSKGAISIKIRPFLLKHRCELINTLKSLENL